MLLNTFCMLLLCLTIGYSSSLLITASTLLPNLTLPHQHPNPHAVVQELQRRLNVSISRSQLHQMHGRGGVYEKDQSSCPTGNPVDDCWRPCDPNWQASRQLLADCGVGFGQGALGGKGGQVYVVSDSSDHADDPAPGTLRHAVTRPEPLWIVFSADMLIRLDQPLSVNSFKTVDGRGADVHVVGGGYKGSCLKIQQVSNVIIHNIHVHDCGASEHDDDGDGITVRSSSKIWIDHCSLLRCTDGLIDVTVGSTAVTISNNYFSHHDKVMLLGHSDDYEQDAGMQVTVAFNRFGEELGQRMPRCRFGYFHIVNNDYREWGFYAVGGSSNPTINSQGNRYIAPSDPNAKQVTKRLDADEKVWSHWNWGTEGDLMVNGAFFVASGSGLSGGVDQAKLSSMESQPVQYIDRLTANAGVVNSWGGGGTNSGGTNNGGTVPGSVPDGSNPGGVANPGMTNSGGGGATGGDPGYRGTIYHFGDAAPTPPSILLPYLIACFLVIIL